MLALALPLTACSGNGDGDGDSSGEPKNRATATAPAPTPTPTPTPVDPTAYRHALAKIVAPLDTALRKVDRAGEGKALDTALDTAGTAADTAAGLLDLERAPDDAWSAHSDLADAVRDLGISLVDAQSGGGRCATSPRITLRSDDALGSVREADAALTALGYAVDLKLPRTEKAKHRRLGNNSLVRDRRQGGLGRLVIKNGTSSDAVVTLAKGQRTNFTVYIRKGKDATVRRVADGAYTVYFASGTDWNSSKRSFTRDCSFQKFDDKADFNTRQVSGGTQYTILTFSLEKTIGGNATTSEVPEDEFPS
ncbi:hypothetical protein OG349_33875 [Streptomyces sp. NBC_01317]|uniref:hypothetical protein n=1 Tax=Streptomyces sp. NBC_01317 TaxID=2903822 RepID=UPI002E129573|nr:hypothetical protein OG349_33875 [Streptomyces sp. NBC_01317]